MNEVRNRRGRRFTPRRKVCFFCTEGIDHIDYKDVELLDRFVSDRGKIRRHPVPDNQRRRASVHRQRTGTRVQSDPAPGRINEGGRARR